MPKTKKANIKKLGEKIRKETGVDPFRKNVASKITNLIPKKFSLSLDCGEKYKSEANTFKEALEAISKDSFGKIKTWGVFTLEMGGKKSQIQLRPIQIKRAFLGHFAQDLLEKRMRMALK